MTTSQDFVAICRKIVADKQALLVKSSKKEGFLVREDSDKRPPAGYFFVDLFSASALVQVLDALNDENRAKLAMLAETDPVKAISVAFKLCK